VLDNVGHIDPNSIDAYLAGRVRQSQKGGDHHDPGGVVEEVKTAGSRPGGAGFPPASSGPSPGPHRHPKYVICNADEGEPGPSRTVTSWRATP